MKRRTFIRAAVITAASAGTAVSVGLWNNSQQLSKNNIIQIGATLPLTGQIAYLGQGEKLGMELALEKYPELKSRVKFIFEDSQGKPELAVSATKKLLDIQNVNIHALSTTGVLLATLPSFKQSKKDVLVFTQSMMPGITKEYPFTMRIYPSATEEMKILAGYIKKKNYVKIGTLNITGNRSGDEAANVLKEQIKSTTARIEISESVPANEKDFKSVLTKLKSKNLDAIMIYGFAPGYPVVLKQMKEVGLKTPVLGNLQLAIGGIEKEVDQETLSRVVFPASRYYTNQSNPLVKEFNAKVKAVGKEPNHDIAYFYDMTSILLQAIKDSPSSSPSELQAAILKKMPYEGVTGRIQTNADRDTEATMILVRKTPSGLEVVSSN
jgi:branched-chain amino acid transport system substrate-binding protein